MALNLRYCVKVILLLLFQISNLALTCPDTCVCEDKNVLCQQCSFNVTFKDENEVYNKSVCCDKVISFSNWYLSKKNQTFHQVIVQHYEGCKGNSFIFSFPSLNTESISMTNTSFTKIKINVKREILKDINLTSNKLQYLSEGMFNSYSNLRQLILNRNEITNILDKTFVGLSKLENLDLSENNLTVLSNVFVPLKSLQHLNLSKNNIEFIHENYFNNWLLQHLDVSHNNLKKVAPGALQLLPNLARLLLTDNPHLGITQLDTQLLVGTGRRLQQIDASRTGLLQVPEAFTHSVRFLSLVGNEIASIRCGDLDSYPLLQSLDFTDNKILSIEDDSLGRLEMLLFLNVNKNLLSRVPKSLPDELKYLSLNNNNIKNISAPDLKGLPNLKILLLKSNDILYIEDHVFDDLLSLEILDLSNNPLKKLSPSTFDGPISLRDLRLCSLNVSMPLKDGAFPVSSPENIQMLHLQSSPGLARQLLVDSAALAAFSHLQYLDLRTNNLTELRNDLIFYLAQLKTLRLHGNKINCTAELWLKDWLSSNKTVEHNETCYFSSSEVKDDVSKYNCTFPEMFTISDSLPPVNLYSAEMINKLLRYYGYLSNKADKTALKNNNHYNGPNKNNTLRKYSTAYSLERKTASNKQLSVENNLHNSADVGNKGQYSRFPDLKSIQADQFIDPIELKNKSDNTIPNIIYRSKSGKRLNTPLEKTLHDFDNISKGNNKEILKSLLKNSTDISEQTEFSPYSSHQRSYAQYIGTLAVSLLIISSLVLWASFRLRFRRRQRPGEEEENQIEVPNISGGVLW